LSFQPLSSVFAARSEAPFYTKALWHQLRVIPPKKSSG